MTGTWLDEILEVGVPLALFLGLWFWSSRKEKRKAPVSPAARREGGTRQDPEAGGRTEPTESGPAG